MASSTLQVLIDIKSKLEGLEQAVAQMRQLKAETEAAAKAGQGGFASLFKIGESIDLTRRLNDLVSELPHKLLEWTLEGIRFNAEIEKSRVGIAAMLRQFDPGQFQTFASAMQASGPVLDLLRAKSIELGVSFPALAEQYQSTVGAMFQGGIRDIQKQIDLTALLRQATRSLPFAQNVIQRDLVDILQAAPRAAVTDVGRTLGIDQQGLDRAKEAGTIAAYLTSKLQGFQQATEFTRQTLSATEERAKTLQQQLAGTFTTDLVVTYKNALDDVNTALAKAETRENVRGFVDLTQRSFIDASLREHETDHECRRHDGHRWKRSRLRRDPAARRDHRAEGWEKTSVHGRRRDLLRFESHDPAGGRFSRSINPGISARSRNRRSWPS
jgi:hypothetical protein